MTKPTLPIPVWLFVLLLTFIGLAAGLRGLTWLYTDGLLGLRSLSWPRTEGVVIASRVEASLGPRYSTEYFAAVTYEYQVGGISYRGGQISFPETRASSRTEIENRLNRYPTGGIVSVYYDPQNPAVACLEPGFNAWFVFCTGPMSLLLLAGGIFGLRTLTRKPANRE